MAPRPGEVVPPSGEGRRVFYWSEDTAAKSFGDGVQRVVRCLGRALQELGVDVVPVGWDNDRRLLRILTDAERGALGIRPASGPLTPRRGDWLLIPEVPARIIDDGSDPIALARAYDLRTAVLIHDLIPLKRPDVYEPEAREAYRQCFAMFATADLVLVTTRVVAADVGRYLPAGASGAPPVAVCPLSGEISGVPRWLRKPEVPDDALRLLTVSRWEPRKNLPSLLSALDRLARRPGARPVHLTVVGRRGGFPAYEAEVKAHLGRLPNVTVRTCVTDAELAILHERHHATVYSSYEEGFGLPVLESLWLATPCLCHAGSAMAEVAPGGGTVMVDMLDEQAIADALARIADEPGHLRALSDAAVARELRTWREAAQGVASSLGLVARPTTAEKSLLDLTDVFC